MQNFDRKGAKMSKICRIISNIFWILLIIIVPWCIFNRFFLKECYNVIKKRNYASYDVGDNNEDSI